MTTETATFANGCFWCTEAVFRHLKGVISVMSGYTGGNTPNPTYEEVCSGATGHAESLQVTFDPQVISYEKLLEIFFATHDPTTLNRQGNDVGTQYRSAIFYHSPEQKERAERIIKTLEKEGKYKSRIVTEVTPYTHFYKAENYHQKFYEKNREYPYCRVIIDPKIKKLLKDFSSDVKEIVDM